MRGLWECGVQLRTREEIRGIGRATGLAALAMRHAGCAVRPGTPLRVLKERAEGRATCPGARDIRVYTSLNDVAVHGAPDGEVLLEGDVVTIDVSLCLDGWYGDVAWSFIAGTGDGRARRLVAAAWEAGWRAVAAARGGVRLSEMARRVTETARRLGCAVAEECAGHGIGRSLHEAPCMSYDEPRVEGYLVPGMVFTVEPVLTAGSGELYPRSSATGLSTRDGSLAAHFEHTVAVLARGPIVLGARGAGVLCRRCEWC